MFWFLCFGSLRFSISTKTCLLARCVRQRFHEVKPIMRAQLLRRNTEESNLKSHEATVLKKVLYQSLKKIDVFYIYIYIIFMSF